MVRNYKKALERANKSGLPSPNKNESIRAYSRRANISFRKARFILSGKSYKLSKSKARDYREEYKNRLISTIKRYNEVNGELDNRFLNYSSPKVQKEFHQWFVKESHYVIPTHSGKHRYSPTQEENWKRTIEILDISTANIPSAPYPRVRGR